MSKTPGRVMPAPKAEPERKANWADTLLMASGYQKPKPKPKRRAKKTPNRRRSKP